MASAAFAFVTSAFRRGTKCPSRYLFHMVLAYHLIFSAYGFWLPNDPRGSWSERVWAYHLQQFGSATRVNTRKSVAHVEHDRALRATAKRTLKYPAVRLSGAQALEVARGFSRVIHRDQVTCWACAIMQDHVHLVLKRHPCLNCEEMSMRLKQSSARALTLARLHPYAAHRDHRRRAPSPWGAGEWKVYLNDEKAIRRAIRYVVRNPLRGRLKRQVWPQFVVAFE